MGATEELHLTLENGNINNFERTLTAKELLAEPNSPPIYKRVLIFFAALLIDTGVPLLFYFLLRLVMDPTIAMIVAGIPALIICIVKSVWKREVSALALILFIGFVLSGIVSFVTKDPRILLLEKSLMMGIVGVLHVVSVVPIPLISIKFNRNNSIVNMIEISRGGRLKPFLYYMCFQLVPLGDMNTQYTNGQVISKYEWLWENIKVYKTHLRVLCFVSGALLLGEFIIKVFMIFSSMSVDDVMIYSNIFFVIVMVITTTFCAIYIFIAKRNFFKHVDQWIAENYVPPQNSEKIIPEPSPTAKARFLIFSDENSSYDPAEM